MGKMMKLVKDTLDLEVDSLLGDFTKARKNLNWKPKYNFQSLVKDMINEELKD